MHYFKRNIGDYHKRTGRLSLLEHGAYTLLIDACYDRERFPTKEEAIEWSWARTQEEIEAVEFVLDRLFTLKDGVYFEQSIADELDKYHGNAEKNKQIAIEREAAKRENRERLSSDRARVSTKRAPSVEENSKESTERVATVHALAPKPRTSNQEPITNNQKTKYTQPKSADLELLVSRGVSESLANDWLKVRKAKKAVLTETALNGIARQAELANRSLEDVIQQCVEMSWAGFNHKWSDNSPNDKPAPSTTVTGFVPHASVPGAFAL